MAEARKAGRLRSEGKTYRVRDGDVLEILFSKLRGLAVPSAASQPSAVELGDDRAVGLAVVEILLGIVVVVVLVFLGVGDVDLELGQEVLARRRSRR